MRHHPFIILVLIALLFAACEADEDNGGADIPQSQDNFASEPALDLDPPCQGRVLAMFDPRRLTSNLPYPSDLFTVEDPATYTGRRLALDQINTPLVDEIVLDNNWLAGFINQTDGFGVSSHVFFPLINDDEQLGGLPGVEQSDQAQSSIQLIELSAEGSTISGRVQFETVHLPFIDQLELIPTYPLKSATTYLAVLTNNVTDSQGNGLCPTWQFDLVRSSQPAADIPETADIEPVRQQLAPYFELLEQQGLPRESIVALTPFTTCSVEQALQSIREQLVLAAQVDPPQIENVSAASGDSRQHVGAIVRGTIDAPDWQDADGHFVFDEQTHAPIQQGTIEVPFVLSIPKPDQPGGPPFPVVVALSGINSSKESNLSFADQFAAQGLAVISIDHPFHGERRVESGSMDPSGRLLSLGEPLRMRDNMRQGSAENLYLVRVIENLDLLDLAPYDPVNPGDGLPDLDPERLLLFGHSLGALLNSMLYTSEPNFIAAAGTAGGGGWTNEVFNSPYLDIAIAVFRLLGMDFEWPPESIRLFFLWYQGIIDPGDSNSYVRMLKRDPIAEYGPRPYLMLEAIGDGTVPNEVTNTWARYCTMPLIEPYIELVDGLQIVPAPTNDWGLFQYPTDNHDFFFGGDYRDYAREQVLHFFTSVLETGSAEIVNPLPESAR
ncbi:MAG: hypothetical protein P9M14_02515 [Candidatus Alcyoniella australis]|nr:hypothetical protein [Candidatus Alcyoniella australis]